MRLLFDENTPYSLASELTGHDCTSVIWLNWRGTRNGELLSRAEAVGFDVLITLDDDMEPDQKMEGRQIAILVMKLKRQGKQAARTVAGQVQLVLSTLV